MADLPDKTCHSRQDVTRFFGSTEACLEHLIDVRKSTICRCGQGAQCGPLYRVRASAYRSRSCGRLLWPTADTLLHGSNVALNIWFETFWLFSISPSGLTVNFVQRYFGISHVAAWRLLTRLRMHVSLLREKAVLGLACRETVISDTDIRSVTSARSSRTTTGKVVGMSDGTEIYTFLLARRRPHAVATAVKGHLAENSPIVTLDRAIYRTLARVDGSLHRLASEDELRDHPAWRDLAGFWVNLKKRLAGTYKHFREENLLGYIKEFE